MCDRDIHSHGQKGEQIHQLIDLSEIKQEPGIKEEPQPVGTLEEFPAFFGDQGNGQSLGHSSQVGGEHVSIIVAENKVKVETDENNGIPTKSNGANEEAVNKRRAKGSAVCDAPLAPVNRSGQAAHNANKSNKQNVHRGGIKQHQCKQCEYKTKYKSHLKVHLVKHTGETPFPCDRCEKAFKSKRSLQNHMIMHVDDFLFSCAICLKGFDEKNEKMKHESYCKTLRYECHLCKKSFGSTKTHLINHMCIHNAEKPFECKECSKGFARKPDLKRHMKLHAGPRPFRCLICLQRFPQEGEMIAHQQKCNRRMYECYVCGKSVGLHKTILAIHLRTHTGDKPFKCNQCPKKFNQKGNLNKHMRIHSRSLPWK